MRMVIKIITFSFAVILLFGIPMTVFSSFEVNRYFSEYAPDHVNTGEDSENIGEYLQYRMNCYGYALGMYRIGNINEPYLQQPGEFSSIDDMYLLKKNIVLGDPNASMKNIVSNLQIDARRLGFRIFEYNPKTNEVAQAGINNRMVAIVVGELDFHAYVQHSNGTWSHKPGTTAVTNLSIEDKIPLTNDNIIEKSRQGIYKNGEIKFLLITKDAVIEYPHGDRQTNPEVPFFFRDKAGELPRTATVMPSTGKIKGYIDFHNDNDMFQFSADTSGMYNVKTISRLDIDGLIYSLNPSKVKPLMTDVKLGNINMNIWLEKGQTVYVKIRSYGKNLGAPYVLTVKKEQ